MIEDIGLNVFVRGPLNVVTEAIDLDRQAFGGRLQLPHDQCHVLVNLRMMLEVVVDIGAEGADVGELSQVYIVCARRRQCVVVGLEIGLLLIDIVFQQRELREALHLGVGQKTNGVEIDMERALDPPAARLRHTAPVLE